MTLRRRLALTVLVTTVPLAFGMLWLRSKSQREAIEREMSQYVTGAMQAGGRRFCEMFPSMFPDGGGVESSVPGGFVLPGGAKPIDGVVMGPGALSPPRPPVMPGPKVALWAYDPTYASANKNAPEIPASLVERLEGARLASEYFDWDGQRAMRLVMRMPWDEGPCAVMLVERQVEARLQEGGIVFWGLAVLCLVVLATVLGVAGRTVRRIGALGAEVRRSASRGYAEPVLVRGSDEIADLADDFNAAGFLVRAHVRHVEERRRMLREFVANTTHDLMIPLTVLQGHLAAMGEARDLDRLPSPEDLHGSVREAQYLASLMHNLGAAAKLDSGAAEFEVGDVDMHALVERVAARHQPLASARGIELAHALPDDALSIRGDVTLLEQAVNNLVHNAVRYGCAGGHVSMLLSRHEGGFRLTVWDDGPGVSDEQLRRIEEAGYRSDEARSRNPEGRGLGLAIVRGVVDRHGFTLTFRRIEEGGLEVTIEGIGETPGAPVDPS